MGNLNTMLHDKRPPEEASKVRYLGSDPTPDTLCHSGSAKQKEMIGFRCRSMSQVSTFASVPFPLSSFSSRIRA